MRKQPSATPCDYILRTFLEIWLFRQYLFSLNKFKLSSFVSNRKSLMARMTVSETGQGHHQWLHDCTWLYVTLHCHHLFSFQHCCIFTWIQYCERRKLVPRIITPIKYYCKWRIYPFQNKQTWLQLYKFRSILLMNVTLNICFVFMFFFNLEIVTRV